MAKSYTSRIPLDVKPRSPSRIDPFHRLLTLKTGERQSRTAFIVQAVREKLPASTPKKQTREQSPPAPSARSNSSFAPFLLGVLPATCWLSHHHRISTKPRDRSAPIRTAARRGYPRVNLVPITNRVAR